MSNGSSMTVPVIVPFGDRAVLVELGGDPGPQSAARAQRVADRIRAATAGLAGWGAAVPAAASVLVHLDPVVADLTAALALLPPIVGTLRPADAEWPPARRRLEIPVRYGGEDGPDLREVAELTGLTPTGVIDAHASVEYRVLFLGFAPGFAYLGRLPAAIVVPRRDSPRVRVPAGSVAIAGLNTAVYPTESPGGWRLLGRTSMALWSPDRVPPALLEPGGIVRFVPERR